MTEIERDRDRQRDRQTGTRAHRALGKDRKREERDE